jgi:hypothetical protein
MENFRDIIGIVASLITIVLFLRKITRKIKVKKVQEKDWDKLQEYGVYVWAIMLIIVLILFISGFKFLGGVLLLMSFTLYFVLLQFPIETKQHVISLVILLSAVVLIIISIVLYLIDRELSSGILLAISGVMLFITMFFSRD